MNNKEELKKLFADYWNAFFKMYHALEGVRPGGGFQEHDINLEMIDKILKVLEVNKENFKNMSFDHFRKVLKKFKNDDLRTFTFEEIALKEGQLKITVSMPTKTDESRRTFYLTPGCIVRYLEEGAKE